MQLDPPQLVMLPVDGPHPRQDVGPLPQPLALQDPGVVGAGPALVRQLDVPLLDEAGDGGVLPVLVRDLVVDRVE